MRTSRLIALAAVLGVALAVPAQATNKPNRPKPKPVCNLVVDAAGDEGPLTLSNVSVLQDPSLDIVSADIAADTTRVVAVIRVAKLTDTSQQSPLGRSWILTWLLNGKSYGFTADSSPLGGTNSSQGKVVLDTAKNEIRFSAAWSDMNGKPQPAVGDRIGALDVKTASVIGYPGASLGRSYSDYGGQQDAASSAATYAIGTPSCVPLGP